MAEVKSFKLGELGEFRNGVNFGRDRKGSGLGLINVKDLYGDSPTIDFEALDLVNLDGVRNLDRFTVKANDIYFARSSVKRDGVGVTALAKHDRPDAVHCGFVIRFRPTSAEVHPLFLTYLLRSPEYRKQIIALSGGSTITNISQDSLASLVLQLPNSSEQSAIVRVLSGYDDLIENNTRRIAILEEMARALYREWFVEFRFPGHEGVRMVESAVGPIPEGWAVGPLSQFVDIDPQTRVPREGQKPFVPMTSLATESMLISNIESREGNSGSKFKNGDTLLARITPCLENGKTAFVQFLPSDDAVAFGSTEYIVLRSRTLSPEFVYLLARSDPFRDHAIKSMTGATGRQRVQARALAQYAIACPRVELRSTFRDCVQPMFVQIQLLAAKNANLRYTRDLLLPKLVSGEIDVAGVLEVEGVAGMGG